MRNAKYYVFIFIALSTILIARSMALAKWSIFDIGKANYTLYGMAMGAARNDGINRIYATSTDTNIYEYTYTGNTWTHDYIGQAWGIMNSLAIGNGRNDGINRIYVAAVNSHMYELTYSTSVAGSWGLVDLGSGLGLLNGAPMNGMNGVALGNGRNDGIIRVYGACDDAHMYEFTYTAGAWYKVDMGSATAASGMTKVTLAAGRNDGMIRVYASNDDTHMYEFTYSGGAWTSLDMGSDASQMRGIASGNGRNDVPSYVRIYGANADGRMFENSYSNVNSSWTFSCMDNSTLSNANSWMEAVILENGENDGVLRLYGADHDTHLYEFTYNTSVSTFTKVDMGMSGSYMNSITSGFGRNDGIVRIYATNANDHIYEYTFSTSTLISENQSNNAIVNAVVYPTFANLSKGDKINFANFTPGAKLVIFTLAGHVIKSIQADANGLIPSWDGTIDNGGKAASGTYIIHSSDNVGSYKTFKIMLIK